MPSSHSSFTYSDLVLPHYDERNAEFLNILEVLIAAVERSRDYEVAPIETQIGNMAGSSSADVARRVASLISDYRYADPQRTFHSLVRLFRGAKDEEERGIWLKIGNELSEHNKQQYGPAVQEIFLDGLRTLDLGDVEACLPLLADMLGHVLSSDVERTTPRSDSLTIHRGAVLASDHLCRLRHEAIGWLERLLDSSKSDGAAPGRHPGLEDGQLSAELEWLRRRVGIDDS